MLKLPINGLEYPPTKFTTYFSQCFGLSSKSSYSDCLYDSEKSVKRAAIQTFGRSKSRLAVKYLMDALAHEEDKEILVEMVRALQEITGNLLTKDEWVKWWQENKSTYLKM